MSQGRITDGLNRLLTLEYRSFPIYLTDAAPWTGGPGDDKAAAALDDIVADQQAMAKRIADLILELNGRIEPGEYPMEFTDAHFLSLDYLIKELLRHQQRNIGELEILVRELSDHRRARDLAEETLGSERAHMEAIESLIRAGDRRQATDGQQGPNQGARGRGAADSRQTAVV
jgi:hypothetical protein